ncbi:MAG: type II toxin-antitoxin system VapC family toxin [Anaerolineae bacterium]|nr:type II toxin-antitoxin system VapC family toxin [Anaerolineae bacterium]
MTGGERYLLDTVIVAAYFNRDPSVLSRLELANVYVSSVTIGELFFGDYKSTQRDENLARIRALADLVRILPVATTTADHYGKIKLQLQRKGRPIPENDIWIAAAAFQYDLVLATRDAHFEHIEGLRLQAW